MLVNSTGFLVLSIDFHAQLDNQDPQISLAAPNARIIIEHCKDVYSA